MPWPALNLTQENSEEFNASPADPWGGWQLHTPPPPSPAPASLSSPAPNSMERVTELINVPILTVITASPFRRYETPSAASNDILRNDVIAKTCVFFILLLIIWLEFFIVHSIAIYFY